MKRQMIYIPLFVLLVATLSLTLTGCVGVGGRWETKAAENYRDMGTGLNQVADAVEAYCEGEEVKEGKCQSIKDMYNKTRQNYINAGNTLRNSITSNIENSYYKHKYQREMHQVLEDIKIIFESIGG
jgi:hypothetical protein